MLKKHTKLMFAILAIILFLFISVIISNYHISIKTYNYSESSKSVQRIIFISDLHGRSFGAGNSVLIKKIKEKKPDIICLGGDFIDEDNTEKDNTEFIELLKKLSDVAPVYYSYGNHDLDYFNNNGFSLTDEIKNTGCIILEEDYIDIDINGKHIRLGGMFNYAFNQQYIPDEEWHKDSTFEFLKEFTDTEHTKILLCHRPDCFIYDDASLWNIDVVLSGHTHGGIWQLPLLGGVIAPEQGIFPKYDKGEFKLNNINLIISSGLSGYKRIPRLFNNPEITVVEF